MEAFLSHGKIPALNASLISLMVPHFCSLGKFSEAEMCFFKVDISAVDIHSAISFCTDHNLFRVLLHLYSKSASDFITPVFQITKTIRNLQSDDIVILYKSYFYLSFLLISELNFFIREELNMDRE